MIRLQASGRKLQALSTLSIISELRADMNNQTFGDQIDAITHSCEEHFQNLSESELNWKPNEKTWSVAQNLQHLLSVNETYYPIVQRLREGKYELPWIGKIQFMVNFFGKFILKSVQPYRKARMKTFPLWEPSVSPIENSIQKFLHHQSELKTLIQSCGDLILKGTVISSPANKNIVYSLATSFDIMIAHEWRHLEQAKEVNDARAKSMNK